MGLEVADSGLGGAGFVGFELEGAFELVYGDVEGVDGALVLEEFGLVGF